MKRFLTATAAIALVAIPASLSAHKMWLLPSTTVVSGDDGWVTFDAAASTDPFYPDHQPLRIEPVVTAPDGSSAKVENFTVGKFRATFDLHLTQQGTWKLAITNGGVMGSWKVDGVEARLPRGTTPDKVASLIPANATDVKLAEVANRNEVFVTLGAPTDAVLKPTGQGLEFTPVTHPDDLVLGEPATLGFTLDGKPAAGLAVTIVPDGARYRDAVGEMTLTTDAKGQIKVKWPRPGKYWLNVTATGKSTAVPNADKRMGYVTTLEVLGR
ncbi:MAG: DUF4198 domain-containing protein [Sphingomonas sp.]|uniref:DUF4198 domain-containing protein n=1 Tax=Sphingomonas sp. TaxID=28214 RepID=UPI001AC05832|nr:DUF4198 domain-containing protein [Sphingomonas sp.]MBN8816936.1 DUF4198 domain-containing protein [Sphingomonas sp.]